MRVRRHATRHVICALSWRLAIQQAVAASVAVAGPAGTAGVNGSAPGQVGTHGGTGVAATANANDADPGNAAGEAGFSGHVALRIDFSRANGLDQGADFDYRVGGGAITDPVPQPPGWAMLAGGLSMLACWRRRATGRPRLG